MLFALPAYTPVDAPLLQLVLEQIREELTETNWEQKLLAQEDLVIKIQA